MVYFKNEMTDEEHDLDKYITQRFRGMLHE